MDAQTAARSDAAAVVTAQTSDAFLGLTETEAAERLVAVGPNALRDHGARMWPVLARQLRSPLLVLLFATAGVSFAVGDRTNAVIIGLILVASVGLGFGNEYRAERASQALHSTIRHTVVVTRDGRLRKVDVVELVPGDLVHLSLGGVVPADIRLLEATSLECDEAVLTGESLPVDKDVAPAGEQAGLADMTSMAWMGTVVHAGAATGVVVATGTTTEFGRIAAGLGERQPETDFQAGLRQFSGLLLKVAIVLTVMILVTNIVLRRPVIDAVLFSLAIAVGITPQLLPAIVSTSLAAGSRQLARRKVLVKRLVCIEDLGDMDVLLTDKTGTLTVGSLTFLEAVGAAGEPCPQAAVLGLVASDVEQSGGTVVGGNPLDTALWQALPGDASSGYVRLGELPFDHVRRMTSVVARTADGSGLLVVKGAPESVLAACVEVGAAALQTLSSLYAQGSRVIAVATRPAGLITVPTPAEEQHLNLVGFLVFQDPPKADAAGSLKRLAALGVSVKVATGDSLEVALRLCEDMGLDAGRPISGAAIDALSDDELTTAVAGCNLFARISPEQKARIVRALRHRGHAVGFLGDGVNDALALHQADIGISVDTATDVAKDGADILLLEKSLDVLADGVAEGRRIFANTIKYVLMGTSSNFGNMFSAAAASGILPFLPMLPSQILLNNVLYDAGQLTIPTDNVDEEQLRRPSHWDIAFIRRFMLFFGPLSSLFDFMTFGIMLGPLHAGADLFRSGWFAESLATQTLVIFAIRTRRIPFLRSRPSTALTLASLAVVAAAAVLPLTPLAHLLGFARPPGAFYGALAGMVLAYLILVELGKKVFFKDEPISAPPPSRARRRGHLHRVSRRAARFSAIRGRRPTNRPQPRH
ncbi:magnesium-translocating P-type ATPase [Pedococcus sp.]|uniref:magnesium-translocating P-type ATPase n=1 Tax=Pedococcus sp. TaxID=2860345 RepID=UPI002E143536|nr:magnesium-translocating P-type ATPase [Pedococcus sp.]